MHAMFRAAILSGTVLLTAVVSPAQFLPTLQANTPEEFAAYLDVVEARGPRQTLASAQEFTRAWPKSELLVSVYELEMQAALALGDAERALRAGEAALGAAPDYIPVLAAMASLLPNQTSEPARIERAEALARRSLELLTAFHPPRRVSLEDWQRAERKVKSQCHSALGMVAYKRGRTDDAIREFETAVALGPEPDAVQYYRLGLLYRAKGNREAAAENLRKAARHGDANLRRLAESALEPRPQTP
jgi:tetratricopeptide (TPR) repeat protein